MHLQRSRNSGLQMFFKIAVLKNFAVFRGKHLCWSLFLINFRPLGLQLYLKEAPRQVFSCEYCEIFKNSFFIETYGGCFQKRTFSISGDRFNLIYYVALVLIGFSLYKFGHISLSPLHFLRGSDLFLYVLRTPISIQNVKTFFCKILEIL